MNTNKIKDWKEITLKWVYKFLIVWGLIGLILVVASSTASEMGWIESSDSILFFIGAFFTAIFGEWITGILTWAFLSFGYWWLWLLIGYSFKKAYDRKLESLNK